MSLIDFDIIHSYVQTHQILLIVFELNIFQLQNMKSQVKKSCLFTIDIRIGQQIIRLPIYSEDTKEDVIKRIEKKHPLKSKAKYKINDKLTQQFDEVCKKSTISQKVRQKIQSFNKQMTIIPPNIINDSLQNVQNSILNSTPFKILEQSMLLRKSMERPQRSKSTQRVYDYSKLFGQQYPEYQKNINSQYQNAQSKRQFNKNQKVFNRIKIPNQEDTQRIIKKYEAIDQKCDRYIEKNIKNHSKQNKSAIFQRNQKSENGMTSLTNEIRGLRRPSAYGITAFTQKQDINAAQKMKNPPFFSAGIDRQKRSFRGNLKEVENQSFSQYKLQRAAQYHQNPSSNNLHRLALPYSKERNKDIELQRKLSCGAIRRYHPSRKYNYLIE